MATQVRPVSGSKIFIGSQVSGKGEVSLGDFAGVSWTEIKGWAEAGQTGDTQEVGEQALISEDRVRKFKTTRNGGTMENTFVPIANDPGQIKFRQAIDNCRPYQFKIEWGANCIPESVVTISVATPGVVTWTGHGLENGQPIVFTVAGGAMPTGLTAGKVYYVVNATTDAFSVAATAGGAPIDTTGAGTGTITASAPPAGETEMFYGLALPGARQGGDATAAQLRSWSIAIDSNIVEV